jgi:hypothetical protein
VKIFFLKLIVLCVWLFLHSLPIGCSDEPTQEPIENGPPEAAENYRYDLPEGETGFSTELPMGHCMVFAGYDSDVMELYLCDPADNLLTGHSYKAIFKPHKVEIINGFCTTMIAEQRATITGAIVIKPPNRKNTLPPSRWSQYGMPDLSQHAIQPDWECYCAPTSAANVIMYFSNSYPELSPTVVFADDPDFNSEVEWLSNRLIAGNQSPFPQSKSFADRMFTSMDGGTTYKNIALGLKTYIDDNAQNPSNWAIDYVIENKQTPDAKALWNKLTSHCASGDGVLLCVIWGVPLPSSPDGDLPNEKLAETERADFIDSAPSQVQTSETVSNEGFRDLSSSDSTQMAETENRSVEIVFPEIEQNESVIISQMEINDETAVIVDDFDLIERKGIWFLKGKEKPFTGKARRSYPGGKTLLEIPYLNGKKHGIQTIWEENGAVLRKIQWKDDQIVR